MREIKFRAWDKDNHAWVTDYDTGEDSTIEFYNGVARAISIELECHCGPPGCGGCVDMPVVHEDIEVMQYTGLHDKNGKEIYEGDIVRHSRQASVVGEIKYYEGAFVVGECLTDFAMIEFNAPKYLEIIGNIYENPELLAESSDD